MKSRINQIYHFLPVQLLLLHFRKYQVLLTFWVILFAAISDAFMAHFGAMSLFLAPEYLGQINAASLFLLGGATCIFAMSWHITTFIVHSHRVPFLGAARHAFLKYCTNNSVIPATYLIYYGFQCSRYLATNEGFDALAIIGLIGSFYLGYCTLLLISFLYFFRVDRDILKTVLARIANPSVIRQIIPYDTLDDEPDSINADTYISGWFSIGKIELPYQYNKRFLGAVLRRHHRNAVFAIFFAVIMLWCLGIFMDEPILRIPAGAGFLILFCVLMTAVGAFKYFLRSWEIIGWIVLFSLAGWLTKISVFDLRSIAYGIKYNLAEKPTYDYEHLKMLFTDSLYAHDKALEIERLNKWKQNTGLSKPTMVIIATSGGGSRAAYWTFRSLQYCDSLAEGKLFQHSVFISGASGGMIGAAYWRELHSAWLEKKVALPYDSTYQENLGKDLLNAVVFSLTCVDFIAPFNKITVAGRRYSKDRGYAFDNELIANTEGLMDKRIADFKSIEASGSVPIMVINGTIINDGRKLMISPQPIAYLTRPEFSLGMPHPNIDGVDFAQFFANADPLQLRLPSALRMSATFPIVLPVVKLPSSPDMNIMDAGLRDNFGMENCLRYLHTFRDWIKDNTSQVIVLQVRDTKENSPTTPDSDHSLTGMMFSPIFAIQQKWGAFQTFSQNYMEDFSREGLAKDRLHFITLSYIPKKQEHGAALNFHLTAREKRDLSQSIDQHENQQAIDKLISALQQQQQ
jgi:hypothetical protein